MTSIELKLESVILIDGIMLDANSSKAVKLSNTNGIYPHPGILLNLERKPTKDINFFLS